MDEKLDVNHVTLVGRIGESPTHKETQGGLQIVTLLVGTDRPKHDEAGNPVTDWAEVTVFGERGTECRRRCQIGSRITIEGKLQSYEKPRDDGGVWRNLQVIAYTVAFLDSAGEAPAGLPEIADGEDFFGD